MTAKNWRAVFVRILALVIVVALTFFIYTIRDDIKKYQAYGYPGIFIITLLANATVFLPAPGVVFVFAMGNILNPFGVALAASAGGALGELSGYLAGYSGQAVIENIKLYQKLQPWVQRYGVWAILVMAAVPNPFFDLAGIAAGALKLPLSRFLVFCWFGQFIKMLCFSLAGYYSITWILG